MKKFARTGDKGFNTASVILFVEVSIEAEDCVLSDITEKMLEEKFTTEFR